MQIRNKKTGQVLDVNGDQAYIHCGNIAITFNSLKWLFDNWEDYEEYTGYWYIDFDGDVLSWASEVDEETDRKREAIGNYFNTREEAEKAVEKLKAWKRLRDNGFRFKTYMRNPTGTYDCFAIWEDNIPPSSSDIAKDLNLLFSQEGD